MRDQWDIAESACEALIRVLRRRDTPDERMLARERLSVLMPDCQLGKVDAIGRELWRSGEPLRLRWVIDPRRTKPVVIWVGQGAPAEWAWQKMSDDGRVEQRVHERESETPPIPVTVTLQLGTRKQRTRWERAAIHAGLTLEDWALRMLDAAAADAKRKHDKG